MNIFLYSISPALLLLLHCPFNDERTHAHFPYATGVWSQPFINTVEDCSRDPRTVQALVILGGRILLEWLLNKAVGPPSLSQVSAERAILHILSEGEYTPRRLCAQRARTCSSHQSHHQSLPQGRGSKTSKLQCQGP